MVGALVLPLTTRGIIEASITRRPSSPSHPQSVVDDRHGVISHLACPAQVIVRRHLAADICVEIGVGLGGGARLVFLAAVGIEGGLGEQAAADANAFPYRRNVVGIVEIVEINGWSRRTDRRRRS